MQCNVYKRCVVIYNTHLNSTTHLRLKPEMSSRISFTDNSEYGHSRVRTWQIRKPISFFDTLHYLYCTVRQASKMELQ